MQYQVLARKWRPQNFHEIVGQEHVSRTLLNALENGRIAHAFLFSGPRGSGKTSTARILAKALNCHEGRPGDPCGSCPSCKEIKAGNCIDVLEIDAASNTGVDNVRQLIEQARYQPARDRHKIFIIDEVHMLSNAAFGALLKTLEEPPAHVAFIMATTEYHKIPATILSRCQQYSFKLISYPLILQRLREIAKSEKIEISEVALEQVVFSSGGSMRDAMSALDQVIAFSGNQVADEDVTTLLGLIEPRILSGTVKAIADNDVAAILAQVEALVAAGQDLQLFCRRLLGQFRNLMVLKAGITDTALLGIPETLLPDLREQASLFSKEDLLRLFETLLKTDSSMKYAIQTRFQLEMGLIELAHVAKLSSLEDLISEFSSLSEDGGTVRSERKEDTASTTRSSAQNSVRKSARPVPERREKNRTEAPSEEASGTPSFSQNSTSPASACPPSGELLSKISAAVGRESLESLLQRLNGARLDGDTVILELGTTNDFIRNQIKENLPVITKAATHVLGKRISVSLQESPNIQTENETGSREPADGQAETEILNRVRKEPVVQSFLDVFPGQVKAEKIDS